MSANRGWLPREGFTADVVFRLIDQTVLNPGLLLPLGLLARYTKRGESLSSLHPTAFRRLKALFYFGLARWLSGLYSRAALNNWKSDRYDWSKEIVVVTGGAGGIGGHVVQQLAERGIRVVVLDIQALTYEPGPTVHYFECDVTSPPRLAAAAAAVRQQVGEPTVLVNNAGVARGRPLLDGGTERDTRFMFEVNTLAHYWTVREFVPAMVRANHGMVVTVASLSAWISPPGMANYAASKAAARVLHEGLATDLVARYGADRVRTVLVCPGLVLTDLSAGCRSLSPFSAPALHPESVADAIVCRILRGESGQVIMPTLANLLPVLGALPLWFQVRTRSKDQLDMSGYRGRQVVTDLEQYYAERERDEKVKKAEESTVSVSDAGS